LRIFFAGNSDPVPSGHFGGWRTRLFLTKDFVPLSIFFFGDLAAQVPVLVTGKHRSRGSGPPGVFQRHFPSKKIAHTSQLCQAEQND
jgi:hypothetical protein